MIKHFWGSYLVTVVGLICGYLWGGWAGLFITAVLAIMEISLSFDNAVVNASVLKDMEKKWQDMFLTVGMIIAVFGMRLVFPIVIVGVAASLDLWSVMDLALTDSDAYAAHLNSVHAEISAFGGMFLLLVFFSFFFNEERELHWLHYLFSKNSKFKWIGVVEQKMSQLGKIESLELMIALAFIMIIQNYLPEEIRLSTLIAGVSGIILYVVIDSMASFIEDKQKRDLAANTTKRAGVMGFLYLEVLDASFSFDGVIGAFAITQDVVIIMVGLMIGAMFVRSMTIYLVRKNTLDEYVFLEHGAHYAIGALSAIMLINTIYHVPGVITGLIGVTFIAGAVFSSIKYKKQHGLGKVSE